MTAASLCKKVSDFGFALLEHGCAIDAQSHTVDNGPRNIRRMSWPRDPAVSNMSPANPTFADYLQILKEKNYSYLMRDGAIVQLQYTFAGRDITKHRIVYWPCPFDIQSTLDAIEEPIVDVIEQMFMPDAGTSAVLRGALRFDFAPNQAAPGHPASHLTLCDIDCRIPVRSPITFDTFARFMLENFYSDVWAVNAIRSRLSFHQEPSSLDQSDLQRMHFNWQY